MRPNDRRGFTLVEVLVALALGAVCVLAVAPMFVAGMKSNAVGWDYSALNALARQRLEELLQFNFTDPRLAVAGGSTVTIDGVSQFGKLYVDQNSNTQSDGTDSASFPYTLVYIVQDFRLSDIVSTGNPAAAKATTDLDATWDNTKDVKYITVIAAGFAIEPRRYHVQQDAHGRGILRKTNPNLGVDGRHEARGAGAFSVETRGIRIQPLELLISTTI